MRSAFKQGKGIIDMCDYSAEDVASRQARVGDKLVTAKISPHTMGLVSSNYPDVAVCVLPGTHLTISEIPPHRQRDWKVRATASAVFQQEDVDLGGFRDGVVFDTNPGVQILFQAFVENMELTVEAIPAEASNDAVGVTAREREPAFA